MASWLQEHFGGGYNSFADTTDLQESELATATNCVLDTDNVDPMPGLGSAIATGLSGTQKAIYLLNGAWIGSASSVAHWAPINNKLAYVVTGVSPPKYTDGTTTENLGVALTASAATATAGAGGSVTGTNLVWYVEFETALGQRSGLSPASNTASPTAQQVDLTSIPLGASGVTKRNIYRSNGAAIQYVGTISDNVATIYSDNTTTLGLGDVPLGATGLGGAAPNLQGIATVHLGRLWGWINNKLYFSEIGAPGIWPATYYLTMQGNITGCIAVGPTTLLVLTSDAAYFVHGSGVKDASGVFDFSRQTPDQIFGCDAPHSLIRTDSGIFYWSPQGLVRASSGGLELMTDKKLSKAEVATIEADAANLRAGYYRGQLVIFGSSVSYLFDLRYGYIAKTTQTVDAVHTGRDALYVQVGTDTKQWGAGAVAYAWTVRTKDWTPAKEANALSHVERVAIHHNGTLTVRFIGDGVQYGSDQTVTRSTSGPSLVWAPIGNWAKRHALEIVSSGGTSDLLHWISWNPPDPDDVAA